MNRDDLAGAVTKIMQNPEFAGLVKELQGGGTVDSPTSEGNAGTQEMLSHLPDVLSLLEPLLGSEQPKQTKENPPEPGHEPQNRKSRQYDRARAEKLMSALKPYLKPGRCEIIDKCLSVLQVTDLMGMLPERKGETNPNRSI